MCVYVCVCVCVCVLTCFCMCCVCLSSGGSRSRPSDMDFLGGARFIAWRLKLPFFETYRRGSKHFWECRACLGHIPGLGPTFKRPCTTLVRLIVCATNARVSMCTNGCGKDFALISLAKLLKLRLVPIETIKCYQAVN